MKIVKLEVDNIMVHKDVITEKTSFHESAYLTKRMEVKYLICADIIREDKPTSCGYATSKPPFGPYIYGGGIVDNAGSNPGNWNNHGSIVEFRGQWYGLYHRSAHG